MLMQTAEWHVCKDVEPIEQSVLSCCGILERRIWQRLHSLAAR